jgi:hypothetical protein
MGDLLSVIHYPYVTQMPEYDPCRAAAYWNSPSMQLTLASYLGMYRALVQGRGFGNAACVAKGLYGIHETPSSLSGKVVIVPNARLHLISSPTAFGGRVHFSVQGVYRSVSIIAVALAFGRIP